MMMIMFACAVQARLFRSASSLKQLMVCRHVAPLGHKQIPCQLVFDFTPYADIPIV